MNTHEIKTDCRGRIWRSADVRRKLVDEYKAAGSTALDFCTERKINLTTFYGWLAKENKAKGVVPVLREVRMSVPVTHREVRVCLPNRVEIAIRVDSPGELALVLQEAARCSV